MKISKFLTAKRGKSQDIIAPEVLDLDFYQKWHDDLISMSKDGLVRHWTNHGSKEGRHPNFPSLLAVHGKNISALPENFSLEMYRLLNPDIAPGLKNEYVAKHHYIVHGQREYRPFYFDHKFYRDLYTDLHGLDRLQDAANHWILHGRYEGRFASMYDLLATYGLKRDDLPANLEVDTLLRLNPEESFENLATALSATIQQKTTRKIRIFESDQDNAELYIKLAMKQETQGQTHKALELHRLSLLFFNSPVAHEHIGNLMLSLGRPYQAAEHYKTAIRLKCSSDWVYFNLSKTLSLIGQHSSAITVLCDGISACPTSSLLAPELDQRINEYWSVAEQILESTAEAQDRSSLIAQYSDTVNFIASTYRNVFRRNSTSLPKTSLNPKRVLIIGLDFNSAPQCFRYRIEQKMEQLEYADYETTTVAWHNQDAALEKINFHDVVIFYRVPAFPGVIKQIEYAKSTGKVTFFELDDLLFEEIGVPPLETYGGQVPVSAYVNLTKDIGSYRAAASLCDYAIASTIPLADKLQPLSQENKCYLHRNGLDQYNRLSGKQPSTDKTLNIFYGSGTLAHNSDFIDGALPAIKRILQEFKHTRLVIAGYLTLPEDFIREFGDQVTRLPFTKSISTYLTYLSHADINIAVLHENVLTDCKSELKWFEAATFSIPSIVSQTRNYLDVIKQNEDGIIVRNTDGWYHALKSLIDNKERRLAIGKSAFDRVAAEYSIKSLSENIDHIIRDAIENHSNKSQIHLRAQ